MYTWRDKGGPIDAISLYKDGKIMSNDASATIGAATNTSVAMNVGMGTLNIPVKGHFEPIQTTITIQGIDSAIAELSEPTTMSLELRWAQEMVNEKGDTKTVGAKAYIRCKPTGLPALSIVQGEIPSHDLTFETTRVQVFVDGKEFWLFDFIAKINKVNGKDWAQDVNDKL